MGVWAGPRRDHNFRSVLNTAPRFLLLHVGTGIALGFAVPHANAKFVVS